jgi:carboxyl-terminal processing protease
MISSSSSILQRKVLVLPGINYYLVFIFTIILFSAHAQRERNYKQEAYQLRNVLSTQHIAPQAIDDQFSAQVFENLFDKLDPEKIFFTQYDIQSLASFRTLIDDELNGKGWLFMSRVQERYRICLERTETSLTEIFNDQFHWASKEFYDPDPLVWEKDQISLILRQKRWIKHKILERVANINLRDSTGSSGVLKRSEAAAIQYVKTNLLRSIRKTLNPADFKDRVAMIFFYSITSVFDPHTMYLSSSDFKYFLSELNTEDYQFGFTISENARGELTVASLVPGGPAWRSGELHISDIVLSMKYDSEEIIYANNLSAEEAREMITDNLYQTLELTVRKSDGAQQSIKLRKEKLEVQENLVRSFVLKGDRKIGYIHLPGFYSQWGNSMDGAQCANDVAKEIIKLKKDTIDGLILDVRFNGGGSLHEAIAMAGIFIDEGPVVMMKKTPDSLPVILKDINRGTIYDGPMVLMVNGQSASASEILAAVLQDYNRSIIVGSQTYGKGTSQEIVAVDPTFRESSLEAVVQKGGDFIKITKGKMYRVSGRSLQGNGVAPDITLPDIYSRINIGESATPFALKRDSTSKKCFYKALVPIEYRALRSASTNRITSNRSFQQLQGSLDSLINHVNKDSLEISLLWSDYASKSYKRKYYQQRVKEVLSNSTKVYQVRNTSSEQQRLILDEPAQELLQVWSKKLKADMYVEESYLILCDAIKLLEKP